MARKRYVFYESEGKSMSEILNRIRADGYEPKTVSQKPVFKEEDHEGNVQCTPVDKEIRIEVKKMEMK